MKWIEARVVFNHPDSQLAADLISAVFFDFGLQGVVVEDPGLEPAEDWAEDAIGRPAHYAVIGYLPQNRQGEQRCRILEDRLAQLQRHQDLVFRINYRLMDEQDWAESWKAFFWPQRISPRFVVKPTWREYEPDAGQLVIELDPGMAFGTGTHPTTSLCMAMLEKYLQPGDTFLDIGTGSGILMIAAAKLGAGRLCGIDKDEVAVAVAEKNLKLNGVPAQQFRLQAGNLVESVNEKYHFVVANILTYVILELLEDITRVLADGAVFVCSGIIDENQNLVKAAMHNRFDLLAVDEKEQWVAIASRLKA
jgi:ribosomal protein L11 methyltransferase